MKVLVVEDNEPLRKAITQRLRESGFAVDETGDGPEGLWMATENKYTVAILDLMLPGMDGLDLLKKLRKTNDDTSVLIITFLQPKKKPRKGLSRFKLRHATRQASR